jgi:MFS family permease
MASCVPLRYRIVALLFFMNLVNYVDRICLSVAAPVMIAALGWDKATFGFAFSTTLVGYALSQIALGFVVDRVSVRRLLAFLCLAWSAMTALTPPATASWALFLAVRFGLGVFEAGGTPSTSAMQARWLPAREYARGQAVALSGTQVGQLLAFPLVTWILTHYSWHAVFYVLAAFGVVWVAAWLAWSSDWPESHASISASELDVISRERLAKTPEAQLPWRAIGASPTAISLILATLLWGYASWLFLAWFPTYLVQARGISIGHMSWIGMLPTATGIIAILSGAALCDLLLARGFSAGVARKTVAATGVALGGLFLIAAIRAETTTGAVASLCVYQLLNGLGLAGFFSLPPVLMPRAPGFMAAVVSASFSVGGIFGPWLAGWLVETTGLWTVPFFSASACNLGAAALLWFGVKPSAIVAPSEEEEAASDVRPKAADAAQRPS